MNIQLKQQAIIDAIKKQFNEKFGNLNKLLISIAPGRVNLIGDHTDYNDGFVLPMTLDRAVYIGLRRRNDDKCQFYSANFNEFIEWDLNEITKSSSFYWSNYIKGIMELLSRNNYKIRGVEGVVYGDVPIASGLSSSAAIEIATLNALVHLFDIDLTEIAAIKLAQQSENDFIGVKCGIMDQFISLLGKKGNALFIDCRSLEYQNVPVNLGKYVLIIVDTKVKRELAKSAYNERRASCEEAVKYFRSIDKNVKALRDVDLNTFNKFSSNLPEVISKRAHHVISENARVLDAVKMLQKGDLIAFGELVYASHKSLKDDYEVSCKELDFIVDFAKNYSAIGARLTGAGFGGCGLIIIQNNKANALISDLTESYQKLFGFSPELLQLVENIEARIC
jgi:galactokinase